MSGIRPHHRPVKTALRRGDLSGTFVVGKYSFSPYMACEHGCIYCDGRAERYWVEGEFDRDIVVRDNLPELLGREEPKLREKGFISIGSGISDAYQPIEARERIMKRCAAVLATGRHPATIMTKSALALRDLDSWAALNEKTRFMFLVSLTHACDDTRAVWEPGASPVDDRVDALRRFKSAGCATGILAMPLLPGITDTKDHVRRLYDLAADLNVDFIMPGGLTLRPGRQKDFAFAQLAQSRPDLTSLYEDIYREDRASGAPLSSYTGQIQDRFTAVAAEYSFPWLVPHRVYQGHLHIYDELNVLVSHMLEIYRARGTDTRPLARAIKRYHEWLKPRKAVYNRHRSWAYEDLDGELVTLCGGPSLADGASSGGAPEPATLAAVLGNEKLANFLSEVIINRKTLDYVTLKLE